MQETLRQPLVLISVCITAYNHQAFIAQALDSVLMQRGDFALEILVGEDGSSDDTAQIIKQYVERYPEKIRAFFHDPKDKLFINGRQTGRKNFLHNLAEAKGDYIALLDGDDYWLDEDKLQKQVAILQQHPDLVACCHPAIYVDENNKQQASFMGHHDVVGGYKDFSLIDVLGKNPAPTLSVLFRRDPNNDYPDLFLRTDMADWPLHMLNALRGNIRYVDEKMAAYRVHAGGVWAAFRDNREKTLLSEVAVWRIIRDDQLFAVWQNTIDQLIIGQYQHLIKLAIKQQDFNKAWQYWREQGRCSTTLAWHILRKQIKYIFKG